MNNEHKKQVSQAINAWIEEGNNERSQNQLCKISKVSPAIVQAIRAGESTYKASKSSEKSIQIVDSHFYKLAEAVGLKFEKEIHFNNQNFTQVHNLCRYAQGKHRRGIIDSVDSGAGKTYALEAYAKTNRNAIYIKATSMMKGRDLITKIMEVLKITPRGRRAVTHLDQITERFIQPGNVIIIDELEHSSPDMWRVIKDIEDATYNKIGLILAGKGLITELHTAAVRNKKLMPQVWRRFKNNKIKLKALSRNNVIAACEEHGITDKPVQRLLSKHVEDWSQLNEYIKDIHDMLISRALEVTEDTVKQLFELDEYSNF
ncbi:ATP-binding protein [Cyclobacterium marinum]|uniref:ORC1/DEAH AAA+ ATPase domain-containing protein n=1 Tax=Cyclobacterium marinum (strain ATCC 25205 / DSM 745 / LMG 13164 / NCIMB 1802) TaxID=880070 RepID=G0IXZ1_CYCMS|nr:ATP-binding protein [Cyclobacterium marinum]AEL24324.1 hypothetical protein Cycma_0549 [Cyclobacterium marinum DSM 745]